MKYILVIFCIILLFLPASGENLYVHFISVGHGDAIFIEFPDGECMLVDGGTKSYGSLVTGYVSDLGYEKIDYVVNTHSHDDHAGGLIEVLKNFDIENMWLCPYNEETEVFKELKKQISTKHIDPLYVVRYNKFIISDCEIIIMNPDAGQNLQALGGPNGASVVMKITYGKTGILLAGDIFQKREEQLVEIFGKTLDCDVLKCSHHGSGASSSEKFLNAVSPKISVVSVGESEYKYPSIETMERIKSHSGSTFRTDINGTITVTSDGRSVSVEAE